MLIRALLFGVLFFVFTFLVFWLVGQYIPELLSGSTDDFDIPAPGSRVNLQVGDDGAFPSGDPDEIDNINGQKAQVTMENPDKQGMDHGSEGSYNAKGELADSSSDPADLDAVDFSGAAADFTGEAPQRNARAGGDLPDIDPLPEAFVPEQGGETVVYDMPGERRPLSTHTKKPGFEGDFDPKELAQAIKTVLRKEEKG
jgi:hypothetical protein